MKHFWNKICQPSKMSVARKENQKAADDLICTIELVGDKTINSFLGRIRREAQAAQSSRRPHIHAL